MAYLPALAALIASAISAPFIYKILLKVNSRQTVSEHLKEHAHKQGTPTMGGLIVLVGLIVGCLFSVAEFMPGYQPLDIAIGGLKATDSFLVLILGFGLIGFIDDFVIPRKAKGKRGLSWIPKLLMQFAVPIGACWISGVQGPLEIAIYTFVILFFANAFNFSDGLDMLAGGLGVIMALGFALLAREAQFSMYGWPVESTMMVVLAFSFLPFLALNAPPAKVFMGDVGSLPIGACFGWVFCQIAFLPRVEYMMDPPMLAFEPIIPLILLSLVMILELVPVPIQILWVKVFKRRAFNFKTPIHHAFQDKGWPETKIVRMFHAVQLLCAILAFVAIFFLPRFE